MPIRPENRKRYPPNWKQISKAAKERAGHKCEFCGVEQYAVGQRDDEGRFHYACGSAYYDQMMYAESYQKACEARDHLNEYEDPQHIVIVLAVAHLDHQPENCEPENLCVLCQRCHKLAVTRKSTYLKESPHD